MLTGEVRAGAAGVLAATQVRDDLAFNASHRDRRREAGWSQEVLAHPKSQLHQTVPNVSSQGLSCSSGSSGSVAGSGHTGWLLRGRQEAAPSGKHDSVALMSACCPEAPLAGTFRITGETPWVGVPLRLSLAWGPEAALW